MKIKQGDNVVVIAGKNKKLTGIVKKVLIKTNRVVIDGVNKVTRHVKKTKQGAGQKIIFEAPIHASNVMVIDPKTKKPSRIYYRTEGGKKVRVTKSGSTLETAAKAPKKDNK